ncbi:MAG: Ig-like domain-containing protein [Deferrisomatales bacterium]
MIRKLSGLLLGALLVVVGAQPVKAVLVAASPNTVNSGFNTVGLLVPEWYQDQLGLQLQYCPLGSTFCLPPDPAGEEGFWFNADILALPMLGGGDVSAVIAIEAANLPPLTIFSRFRIGFGAGFVPGDYRITHPFGVDEIPGVVAVPDPTPRVIDRDLDPLTAGDVGPFLYADTGVPFLDPGQPAGDNFNIGDLTPRAVFGSPLGTNFFRVERKPAGAPATAYVVVAETNLFDVAGKVFTAAGTANSPPTVANDPVAPAVIGVLMNTPRDIDVLANDTPVNVAINPTALAFPAAVTGTSTGGGTLAQARVLNKVMARYTPAPGFTGPDTFAYNVRTFTGLPAAAPATVTVFVEDLALAAVDYRVKLMRWGIEGTSSDDGTDGTPNTITVHLGPDLTGPVLGTAPVRAGGGWSFEGQSTLIPGATPTVSLVSTNGVTRLAIPLRLR